jgi:transcription elongation factor GreB
MTQTNYITPEGFQSLRVELLDLLNVQRPKMARAVGVAAAEGDRSENAEYIYGKKRLREIDKRFRYLQQRLDNAEIVDTRLLNPDIIAFSAWVTLEDDDGEEIKYRIVGQDEFDPAQGWISWSSPVGRALLGKQVDDSVIVSTPKRKVEYTILEISYSEQQI